MAVVEDGTLRLLEVDTDAEVSFHELVAGDDLHVWRIPFGFC